MARVPPRGATIASPHRNKAEFKHVLCGLCPGHIFEGSVTDALYMKLATVIGRWFAETYRVEVSQTAGALLSTGRLLDECVQTLSGLETGIRSAADIEVTSRVATILALDPHIGSIDKAKEILVSFQSDAGRIAHACLVAAAELATQAGKPGRPKMEWYNDFTTLLLKIATEAGIKADLQKDRIDGARSGWLFDAAQAFETFLDPAMQSGTPEACFKRLERSKARLERTVRQNGSPG